MFVADLTISNTNLSQVEDGLRGLIGLDTSDWGTPQRLTHLERVERIIRVAQGLGHTIVNQMREAEEALRANGKRGRLKLRDALADRLRITPYEAAQRIEAAKDLGVRTVGGELEAPRLPEAARAQLEGQIGSGHLRVLMNFDHGLSAKATPSKRAYANQVLADYATWNRPDALKVLALAKSEEIDPTDTEEKAREREQARSLQISAPDEHGRVRIKGLCNPELAALLEPLVGKFSALTDEQDQRTWEQRLHDAFLQILRLAHQGPDRAKSAGARVQLYVHTTLEEVRGLAGVARTPGGNRIPLSGLFAMAGEIVPYLAIFRDKSRRVPLELWRGPRLATEAQRMMLAIIERGCTHPGCNVTAAHCEVHHIQEWRNGGMTNLQNLTLVCDYHHHLLDEGWQTARINGVVHWIAPGDEKPKSNHHHHPRHNAKQAAA